MPEATKFTQHSAACICIRRLSDAHLNLTSWFGHLGIVSRGRSKKPSHGATLPPDLRRVNAEQTSPSVDATPSGLQRDLNALQWRYTRKQIAPS